MPKMLVLKAPRRHVQNKMFAFFGRNLAEKDHITWWMRVAEFKSFSGAVSFCRHAAQRICTDHNSLRIQARWFVALRRWLSYKLCGPKARSQAIHLLLPASFLEIAGTHAKACDREHIYALLLPSNFSTPNMTGRRFHRTMEIIPALPW